MWGVGWWVIKWVGARCKGTRTDDDDSDGIDDDDDAPARMLRSSRKSRNAFALRNRSKSTGTMSVLMSCLWMGWCDVGRGGCQIIIQPMK